MRGPGAWPNGKHWMSPVMTEHRTEMQKGLKHFLKSFWCSCEESEDICVTSHSSGRSKDVKITLCFYIFLKVSELGTFTEYTGMWIDGPFADTSTIISVDEEGTL